MTRRPPRSTLFPYRRSSDLIVNSSHTLISYAVFCLRDESVTGVHDVFKVEDEEIGQPGQGQVRLRPEAIGVNFIDTAFREGTFPMTLPGVTGVEGAGVVEAVGPGVKDIKPGDRMA